VARKAGLHVEVSAAPVAESLQHGDEFLAGAVERVGDLWRDGVGYAAQHQAVFFELAQLLGKHLFGNRFQFFRISTKRRGRKERCQRICTFHLPEIRLTVAWTGHP